MFFSQPFLSQYCAGLIRDFMLMRCHQGCLFLLPPLTPINDRPGLTCVFCRKDYGVTTYDFVHITADKVFLCSFRIHCSALDSIDRRQKILCQAEITCRVGLVDIGASERIRLTASVAFSYDNILAFRSIPDHFFSVPCDGQGMRIV